MESKKINQLATELAPDLSDLTIIGDPTTGISKKITLSQMASLFTGTVEEYANLAAFPLVGVADTIYIALDTNILYRWNTGTSAYVELSPNIVSSLVFNDANGFDGTINLVGSVATLTITTALTTGSVGFIGASGALTQNNANFFWDATNNRLGLGINAPTTALDVFGSGIIGRINGTSTNNAFLGFASAGTNKWSIGNVQSDHRFRIYNEATTSELVSVLSTGEFGIGIANPTTKIHIDGGASALIANLDANVSVAKSISFRSDNSNRINLEVSGTESGSNAGANFFIRRYSDAGALIDTPLTITRSTGAISLASELSGTSAVFSSSVTATNSAGTFINVTNTGGGFAKLEISSNATSTATLSFTNSLSITGGNAKFSAFLGVNGSPGTSYPLEAYINSATAYSSTSRGNVMRIYNSNSTSNIFAGIELGGAGPSNDGLAGINAVVTSAGSAALTFYTRNNSTFLEKMHISSSGMVGIGGAPNSWDIGNVLALQIKGTALWTFGNGVATFLSNNIYYDGSNRRYIYSDYATEYDQNAGSHIWFTNPIGTAGASFTQNERMRITNAGKLLVGRSSTIFTDSGNAIQGDVSAAGQPVLEVYNQNLSDSSPAIACFKNSATTSSSARFIQFYSNGGTQAMGGIVGNGAANVQFATISDIREKENIISIAGSLNKILLLNPVEFDWINTGEHIKAGFVAQQVEEIFPEYVVKNMSNDGEEERKGLTGGLSSGIIAHLVKAIQELKAEIDILKAK